jgi:hypothetical protein
MPWVVLAAGVVQQLQRLSVERVELAAFTVAAAEVLRHPLLDSIRALVVLVETGLLLSLAGRKNDD